MFLISLFNLIELYSFVNGNVQCPYRTFKIHRHMRLQETVGVLDSS